MRTLGFASMAMSAALLFSGVAHADAVTTAKEHYTRGSTLFDLGRFEEAAKEFEAAYEAKNDPALLFNIGQSFRSAGLYAKALVAYRAFLRKVPQARPFLMYGLTEAFRSTYLPPEEIDRRPDSIGKAIPNAEILVLREDGSECDVDEPGVDEQLVRRLVARHVRYTGSPRGKLILSAWNDYRAKFVKVMPIEYRRALQQLQARARVTERPEISVAVGDD